MIKKCLAEFGKSFASEVLKEMMKDDDKTVKRLAKTVYLSCGFDERDKELDRRLAEDEAKNGN